MPITKGALAEAGLAAGRPRDAGEYYWMVKMLRNNVWTVRHDLVEHIATAMNPRHARDMFTKVVRAMGPDELLWGTDTGVMAPSDKVIGLPDKTKKQLTLHTVLKHAKKNRRVTEGRGRSTRGGGYLAYRLEHPRRRGARLSLGAPAAAGTAVVTGPPQQLQAAQRP